jgi:hypothetical protein
MLTFDQIKPYLEPTLRADLRHEFYAESVRIADEIAEVFGRAYPSYLDKNRPKEKAEQKKYRKDVYDNPFIDIPDRVAKRVGKIRQSEDFIIAYPDPVPGVPDDETLQGYCENRFGPGKSVEEWLFTTGRKWYLKDPNAVVMVLDKGMVTDPDQYRKPLPYVISSKNVVQFRRGSFAVLQGKNVDIVDERGKVLKGRGRVMYFFDKDSYTIARQTKLTTLSGKAEALWAILGFDEETGTLTPPTHNCEGIPCFKIGETVSDLTEDAAEDEQQVYKSLLTNMLPHLRKAQQRISDSDIEFNFHVNSREWLYALFECTNRKCAGGHITERYQAGDKIYAAGDKCPDCGGSGYRPLSSMDTLMVKPQKGNTGKEVTYPPVPPGGFIARSIEPVREMILAVKAHEEAAWATIDMQQEMKNPLNVSGKKKELDMEASNTTMRDVAGHFVNGIAMPVFSHVNRWRYFLRWGEKCDAQRPVMTVPVNFNLLDSEYIQDKLAMAKEKSLSPVLVGRYTRELMERSFGRESVELKLENLAQLHDVMYGQSMQEKLLAYGGGRGSTMMAVTQRDYIISIRIYGFLLRAMQEDGSFAVKPYEAQRAVLEKYADEVIEDNPDAKLYDPRTMGTLNAPLDLKNTNQRL